jgi:hypothetical protein
MTPLDGLTVRGYLAEDDSGEMAAVPGRHEVVGQVKGTPPERATVRAVLSTLREGVLDEQVVAESLVGTAGEYRLAFDSPPPSAEASDTSLIVRLYSPGGEMIGESAPVLSPESRTVAHVRPDCAAVMPSEYALVSSNASGWAISSR